MRGPGTSALLKDLPVYRAKFKDGDFYPLIINLTSEWETDKEVSRFFQENLLGNEGLALSVLRNWSDNLIDLRKSGLPYMFLVNQYGDLVETELNNPAHALVILAETLGLTPDEDDKKRAKTNYYYGHK